MQMYRVVPITERGDYHTHKYTTVC